VTGLEGSQTVVDGGLHPATFLLRLGRLGRFLFILALPVLFRGAEAAPLDFLGPALLFVALGTVGPLLELMSFRYRLTPRELTIRSGVLNRTERRIPVDRIHDLGFEQSFVRRLLGLVTVTVETSGSGGPEATLDALSREAAQTLRRHLEAHGAMEDAPDGAAEPGVAGSGRAAPRRSDAATPGEPGGRLVHRASPGALLVRGLTDNRAGLLFVAVISLAELLAIGLGQPLELLVLDQGVRNVGVLARTPVETWLLLGAIVVAVGVAVGWVVSGVLSLVAFFGFTLTYDRGLFVRSFGLLTNRRLSVPAGRIQLVRMVESPLRRLVGVGALQVESAGSLGPDGREGQAGTLAEGTETFVPLARRRVLVACGDWVLAVGGGQGGDDARPAPPEVRETAPGDARRWRRTSPRIIPRYGIRGALLGLATAAIAGVLLGDGPEPTPVLTWTGALAGTGLLMGFARFRALAYELLPGVLVFRDGILGRTHTWVPLARVEAASVSQRAIERVQGVARLELHVLGGGGAVLPNVPVSDARDLLATVIGPLPHAPALSPGEILPRPLPASAGSP